MSKNIVRKFGRLDKEVRFFNLNDCTGKPPLRS